MWFYDAIKEIIFRYYIRVFQNTVPNNQQVKSKIKRKLCCFFSEAGKLGLNASRVKFISNLSKRGL